MARNRTIYQSEGLFVSQNIQSTGSGSHAQLRRVQTANYNYEISRKDINQYGQLAAIDRIVTQTPTVATDLSYYLGDGYNEKVLGFFVRHPGNTTEGNFASGSLVSSSGQNFFIVTSAEGIDLNNETGPAALSGKGIIGVGNGYITNYEVSAAVGDIPTVSVSVEGLNTNSFTYVCNGTITGTQTPAIAPESGTPLTTNTGVRLPLPVPGTGAGIPTALRPGDITLSFGGFTGLGSSSANPLANVNMSSSDSINIQNFSISCPLSSSPIERLGSKFAFARVVDFPVTATMSVSAIVNEVIARNLALMLEDTSTNDISVTINKVGTSTPSIIYTLKGAQLDSESFSSDIGSNKSVELKFSAQVGGPNDQGKGLFCSGAHSGNVFA